MRTISKFLFIILIASGCTKALELPDTTPDNSILVVEGDIKTGTNSENIFKLSRLKPLFEVDEVPELNAQVEIVAENGTKWALTDQKNGEYTGSPFLPTNIPLAVRIQTSDGKTYESAFQNSLTSPDIDSVTFKQEEGGVRLYVHASNNSASSKNYRWTYTETWENRSRYETYHDFVNGDIVPRPLGDQIYRCWKSEGEKNVIVNNTTELGQDVISYQPIAFIPNLSEKFYTRYSVNVQQIAITKEAYDFWEILRKNTELTGSLFDPQPSIMPTNIKCTNDPTRKAVGFVSVGKVSEKRIFILNSELNLWPTRNENASCAASEMPRFIAERFLSQNKDYLPAYLVTAGGGFGVAPRGCVDCRLNGGINVEPTFW
jgi:hypothetical protein